MLSVVDRGVSPEVDIVKIPMVRPVACNIFR